MTSRLNPYLNFPGNAREAIGFYQSVFGGEVALDTFGEYGDPDAPGADKVMHAQLETPLGFTLMCSDMPEGMPLASGSRITISLSGDDSEELRGYFKHLSEGGDVSMPLERQVWSDEFGMCTDKYGVPWMVNVGA